MHATKITHIIIGLNVGGAELMLMRLIESNSQESGYLHSVISLTELGDIGKKLSSQGVDVHCLNMKNVFQSPVALIKLILKLNGNRPDIVQTWMYHADLLGGLSARISGIKNVIWGIRSTDITVGTSRTTVVIRWICARLSHWLPHTIVCAAEESHRVHVALGYRADRMVVVSNGFNLSRMKATPVQVAAFRSECGFTSDLLVVGTLGRFNVVKDQHNFVRAAGLLACLHPKVRFLMVGRDCDVANAQLMRWIDATGYADRFVLMGERSDVPVCLAAMDVFCMSSRTEGFPNVVGEAMAMRKACVVTDVGDAAYLLDGCGFVVPKENSAALADGMAELIGLSHGDRAALGERAYVRIANDFTMQRTCERFEAVYANMLAGRTADTDRAARDEFRHVD